MVAEAINGIQIFTSLFNTARGLLDLHDATARDQAVYLIQKQVLDAQAQQFVLIQEVSDLRAQLARFDAWDTEKQRYELKDVGDGSFAYAIKENVRGPEPVHQICATCYQHRKKSILQPRSQSFQKLLGCPECKTDIVVGFEFPSV